MEGWMDWYVEEWIEDNFAELNMVYQDQKRDQKKIIDY